MPLDISRLSDTTKDYLYLDVQKYRGSRISEIPQRIILRAEIIHCLIQSNIPNTRVTALSHAEKAKHPLYRVIDSFFDEQGELQDAISEPMWQEHESMSDESHLVGEAEREEDWDVKAGNKSRALHTIQACFLGGIYRDDLETYFGCTGGTDEQQHGDEMEKLFSYFEGLFLPRGKDTQLTLEEKRAIIEKLPNYPWESMTDWENKAA